MRELNPNQKTPKTATLILFLSDYNKQAESEYDTDRGFCVTGAQTNEAPVKYAVKRLAENNKKLDRIIALVTPKAKESALERFTDTVKTVSPDTNIDRILILDTVTTTELLQKTLEQLLPVSPSDSLIIETTGGYRNAVSALTLLSRFLRYSGTDVEFSTFSDNIAKRVTDTREIDDLFNMLDAVNVFAGSGNPKPLIDALRNVKEIPGKTEFVTAIRKFYDTVLCCKISQLDMTISELRAAITGIINAEYEASSAKILIFRDLVREIVRTKMAFIFEDAYLKPFVLWCCENDYLQQAVTVLWEKMLIDPSFPRKYKSDKHFDKIRTFRNNFNHADGEELRDSADNIRDYVRMMVKSI